MKKAKFILYLFFLLFATNHLFAQLLHTTKEEEPVKFEKNREIRHKNNISESFEYLHEINSKDSILNSHKTYNKNGDLLTNTFLSLKQDTINYVVNEYDGKKLTKTSLYIKNEKNPGFNHIFNIINNYSYDKNGNNNEIQIINMDGKIIYKKIDYDNNNLKKVVSIKWPNKTDFTISTEYLFLKNNLIKEKKYAQNGQLVREIDHDYDDQSRLISSYTQMNGKKIIADYYSYDKKNNLIKCNSKFISNRKPPYLYKFKYEYDANNNVIKEYHFKDNKVQSIHTFTYKKFE